MKASEFILPFGMVKSSIPLGEIADMMEIEPRFDVTRIEGVRAILAQVFPTVGFKDNEASSSKSTIARCFFAFLCKGGKVLRIYSDLDFGSCSAALLSGFW